MGSVFPAVDCQQLEKTYGNQLPAFAYFDWQFIDKNHDAQSSGCLQCFCYQQWQEVGLTAAAEVEYGPTNTAICGDFFGDILRVKIMQEGLTYALSIFNIVIRYMVIFAVQWVGYDTQTA